MSPARHLLRLALKLVVAAYGSARHVARTTPLRLTLFAGLALAASWALLSTAASLNEFRDAHVLAHYEVAAREAVTRWHQAPLWDPYYCGGMYALGTPQARFASPTFLLTLLFGETRGESLTVFVMLVVGLEGTFRYARDRGATRFGALLGAPFFALGGIFAISPSLGWISFFSYELLPWMALGMRQALRGERAGIVVVAVAAAWCVGFGGTYAAPMAVVWCALEVIEGVAVRLRRHPRRAAIGVGVAAAAGALAIGLAAVRLWPIAETMQTAPRIIGGTPANSWTVLTRMFFFPLRSDSDDGEFYVGFFVVPALLLGLARRHSIGLGIGAVLWTWLAAGYAFAPSLFAALRELPLYTTLRYPERFLVLLGLVVATLAARGISLVEAYVRTPRAHASKARRRAGLGVLFVASMALVVGIGPLVAQHPLHDSSRPLANPPEATEPAGPFHQSRGNRWALAYYEPMQRGSLSCWEAYPVPESPLLRGDLASEERVVEAGAGTVTERRWSPNAIDLDVSLKRPATIAINQNWHPGWRANVGEVRSDRGLLTVALPEGDHDLSLRFAPRSATGGALASLVAAGALGFIAWRARRAPRVTGLRDGLVLALLALSPLVPVLATAAAVPQQTYTQPLQTPEGQPIIADALDEGAVRIDAKFADGVVLEAATLSDQDPAPGADLTLELDWRRGQTLDDSGIGVFVHIEPSKGTPLNGDHVLLSGMLDLENAPPDKILRDILPLYVPEDAHGKQWKIWVGLWRVRRGGSRVPLVDGGHALVDGDRVLAASFEP
jgi:hypothetical protein